jgi:hypothetical protein
MRGMSKGLLLGVLIASLAIPVQAKPRESGWRFERTLDPIVKVVRKIVMRTLGDGLVDPRP